MNIILILPLCFNLTVELADYTNWSLILGFSSVDQVHRKSIFFFKIIYSPINHGLINLFEHANTDANADAG